MQKTKRILLFTLLSFFVVICSLQPAMANSAPPAPFCYVVLENLPPQARYVDLLVPMTENAENYCEPDQLPNGFSENSAIVSYNEDGYMSYTFHYKEASSQFEIRDASVCFFEENYAHGEYFKQRIPLKLAILDKSGEILQISEPFFIYELRLFYSLTGIVYYDAVTQKVTVGQSFSVGVFLIVNILGIIISVICEAVVGLFFRFRKGKTVVTVNLISQIIMRGLFYWLYGTLIASYVWLVLVLEVLVYTAEYFAYRLVKLDPSKTKTLIFTVVANTVSLLVGIALSDWLLI